MENKLKNIANHLLDLGKKNRLLNFKETGLKSLPILNKNLEEIFSIITAAKELSFFSLDSVLEKFHKDIVDPIEKDSVLEYSNLKVMDITDGLLKKNQLLGYKKGYPLLHILNFLEKDYKFSIREKGINTLYLSFGFIEYREGKDSYLAPILLISIQLYQEKGIYKIKEYEDDVVLNPTLKYFLKVEKSIDLEEYNDEGLYPYLKKIEDHIDNHISLREGCAIGIYSFLKMNMYNDLINNMNIALQNKNIKALLGDTTYIEDKNFEEKIFPVVNYDSSQLEAIHFAANGKSFCLQGPPGSGKSQTITNIISTLLGNKKHVLFVSEKLAALQVVYDNLKRVGLEDFAIELHSNKANKKDFIQALYKTALLPKYDVDNKSEIILAKHKALDKNINEYYNEIHKKLPQISYSFYELASLYLSIDLEPINFKISINNITDFDKLIQLLDSYMHYAIHLGYNYKDMVFYGLKDLSRDYIDYDFESDFLEAITFIKKLIVIKEKVNSKLSLKLNNIQDIYQSVDFIDALVHLKTYHPNYLNADYRDALLLYIQDYLDTKEKVNSKYFSFYRESILKEDIEALYLEYKSQNHGIFKFFNTSFKNIYHKILAYRICKAKPKQILLELEDLILYQKNIVKLENINKNINKYLPDFTLKNINVVKNDLINLKAFPSVSLSLEDYKNLLPFLTDTLIAFKSILLGNEALNKISFHINSDIFDIYKGPIESVLHKLQSIYINKENLKEYNLLLKVIEDIQNNKLNDYLDYYLSNGYDLINLSLQFKKQYYHDIIFEHIDKSLILKDFTSYKEDKIVEEFKELDEQILHINRDSIISLNSKRRPDDVLLTGSKFKILINEANKQRRQKPIRLLLEEIFELALDIKPVFLMSPLSVSTYLTSQVDLFDCVIFDEASQIFASDALGAIYRAKQCIVIGDNKQMPPSNFFSSVGIEEDNDMEVDSILDMAELAFLSSRLKWHYRSRSEELITFSNQNFYDNALITIPQAKKHREGFGVDFYYLSNGRYDKNTRTNLIEANKVCDMVFEHMKTSKQSLGVVAFSDAQASLIENIIDTKKKDYPELLPFFNEEKDESFFVKNLESVQGDERDRIIFSICYGYNEENKFYQRFGPLNNIGGERRLNVAITRAKYNISVVSSIKHTDIKLDYTESIGVRMLKSYLEFIENIEHHKNYDNASDGIIIQIKRYLEELGYTCYMHYGSSQFKIDLAVSKNDECIMAIMLDNKNKFKMNTTDKYRLEELLLSRLGWKYYKLYSTSWILQKNLEQKKLKNRLEENFNSYKKENKDFNYLKEDTLNHSLESYFIEYQALDIALAKTYLNINDLEYVIRELVRIEQPIHEEYLYKKLSEVLDTKVTNSFKKIVHQNLSEDILKFGNFYCMEYLNDIRLRIHSERNIKYICKEELMDGIYQIVKKNNGITIDGCYRTLIQILGFNKISENTKKVLDDAIIYLKLDGKLTQRGESLFA